MAVQWGRISTIASTEWVLSAAPNSTPTETDSTAGAWGKLDFAQTGRRAVKTHLPCRETSTGARPVREFPSPPSLRLPRQCRTTKHSFPEAILWPAGGTKPDMARTSRFRPTSTGLTFRSEEHTSELQL